MIYWHKFFSIISFAIIAKKICQQSFANKIDPGHISTLPDMLGDEWPSNVAHTLCVIWSEMEFQLLQVCCDMPYHWELLDNRTGDKFQVNIIRKIVFLHALIHYNFIKVLWFPHYMRLRQFTGFNPRIIPRYQITHPFLPLFLPILYSFWRLLRRLHKFSLSVLASKYTARGFSTRGKEGGREGGWELFDDSVWSILIT